MANAKPKDLMTTNEIIREHIFQSTDVIRKSVELFDELIDSLEPSILLPKSAIDALKEISNAIYRETVRIGCSAAAMEVK